MNTEITNLELDTIYKGRIKHNKRKPKSKIANIMHYKLIWKKTQNQQITKH